MSASVPLRSSEKFENVQILRGIAASIVVLHHYFWLVDKTQPGSLLSNFYRFKQVGAGGVDIFFCISGFVITYAARNLPRGAVPAARFAFRRFWRVVPLYWIFTSLAALMWLSGRFMTDFIVTPALMAHSYFLIPYAKYRSGIGYVNTHPFLDPGWTLTFEMYFYIVCSLTILMAGGRRVFPLAMISIGTLALAVLLFQDHENPITSVLSSGLLLEFMAGVLIARFLAGPNRPRTAFYHYLGVALIIVGGAAFLGSTFTANPIRNRIICWGIPGVLIVAGAVLAETRSSGAIRKFFIFLGTASYTIYLAHPLIEFVVANIVKRPSFPRLNPDFLLIALTVTTILLSSLLYFVVERPLMKLPVGNPPSRSKKAVHAAQAAVADT